MFVNKYTTTNLNTKMISTKLFLIFFHQHVYFLAILLMGLLRYVIWDFLKDFHIFMRECSKRVTIKIVPCVERVIDEIVSPGQTLLPEAS